VVACALLSLWGNTSLEVVLGLAVLKSLASVVLTSLKLKVFFHHIKVVLVIFLLNSGVFIDENAKLVKGLCDESALLFGGGGVAFIKEGGNVNDGDFRE
jgi:hypothetical protein